jgi:hypothetical protein
MGLIAYLADNGVQEAGPDSGCKPCCELSEDKLEQIGLKMLQQSAFVAWCVNPLIVLRSHIEAHFDW